MAKKQIPPRLISQSDDLITVAEGEMPVIRSRQTNSVDPTDFQKIMNFLRSGCPGVQVVMGDGNWSMFLSDLKGIFRDFPGYTVEDQATDGPFHVALVFPAKPTK